MDPSIDESIVSDPTSSITLNEEDTLIKGDKPTFDIEQVQLQFDLKHGLKFVLVQNNEMYLLLSESIIRINLETPSDVCKIKLPTISNSPTSEITNAWLHPNGLHLIVQINNSNYYYLHHTYKTLKPLTKFKNLLIAHITFFDHDPDQVTTGEFLIGTSDGQLLLSSLKSHTTDNKRDDKYVKLVHKFPSKNKIWGLAFSKNLSQINVFCGNNQYTWDCFDTSYAEIVRVFKSPYKEVTLPSSNNGLLAVNNDSYVCLLPSNKLITNDIEINLADVYELPESHYKLTNFIISRHHLIGLNHDHLIIFNKLSLKLSISSINLLEFGKDFFGITVDEKCNTFWLYNDDSILEIVIQNESKSVWYNYYKMGRYEEALNCLDKKDPSNAFKIDMIFIKKGYDCLQRGGFGVDLSEINEDNDHLINLQIEGIRTLANLTEPFEKVSLMLLNLSTNGSSSLSFVSDNLQLEYLLAKFEIARDIDKNKIRLQILSGWIIELMLRIIYRFEKDEKEHTNKVSSTDKQLQKFNMRFQEFLLRNYKHLHRQTVYQIITDLRFPKKLIYYAELIEDYDFILYHYIDNSQWKDAVKCLLKIYISEKHSNAIIYKTSTILLTNYPKATIEAWLKFENNLDGSSKEDSIQYEKFLPAILTYNKNNTTIPLTENYGIQYLKQIIFEKGAKSKDVNNTYLSLLITYPDSKHNKPMVLSNFEIAGKMLTKFLNLAHSDSNGLLKYNSQFILRLCLTYKQYQTAVLILIQDINLFEQALKLALENSFFELGEFVLSKFDEKNPSSEKEGSTENDEFTRNENNISKISLLDGTFSRRKKLWITFAKYLIDNVCADSSKFVTKLENENGEVNRDEIADVSSKMPQKLYMNIQNVTKNLDLSTSRKNGEELQPNELNLIKLNEVLKYVLDLANSESNGDFIGLKDLLPLVPENIIINSFKDEIVNSLNQYNEKIGELSREMKESLEISSKLKQQIKEMSKKSNQGKVYSIIQPGEACLLCKELLIKKNFIYFPNCHHGFHKDCLIRSYLKLKNYRFKKIFENFKLKPTEFNRIELDENLQKECFLCNELNINQIDLNLIDPVFDNAQILEWEL